MVIVAAASISAACSTSTNALIEEPFRYVHFHHYLRHLEPTVVFLLPNLCGRDFLQVENEPPIDPPVGWAWTCAPKEYSSVIHSLHWSLPCKRVLCSWIERCFPPLEDCELWEFVYVLHSAPATVEDRYKDSWTKERTFTASVSLSWSSGRTGRSAWMQLYIRKEGRENRDRESYLAIEISQVGVVGIFILEGTRNSEYQKMQEIASLTRKPAMIEFRGSWLARRWEVKLPITGWT